MKPLEKRGPAEFWPRVPPAAVEALAYCTRQSVEAEIEEQKRAGIWKPAPREKRGPQAKRQVSE